MRERGKRWYTSGRRMRQLFALDFIHDLLGNAEPMPPIVPKGMSPIIGINPDETRWKKYIETAVTH